MEHRCLLYPSMFANYADYLEGIKVQNSGYMQFTRSMSKDNWENANPCDVYVVDSLDNGTLGLRSFGVPQHGHHPIPPWNILVDLNQHLLDQPRDLSTRIIIVQCLSPSHDLKFAPVHVMDFLGIMYDLDPIFLWSIYESIKNRAESVDVDRLSFSADYLALHVEFQGGSPVRAWATITKKIINHHCVKIVVIFLNHRCAKLDRELYPTVNPLKGLIKERLPGSNYAWNSQITLQNAFEAYQQYNGSPADHAALGAPESAHIKFLLYAWKSMGTETVKRFNEEPVEFMTPLLTLFRQAFAADLQNLRSQYRPIAGKTHATESHEMLLALWIQARRDIETFSTTTRAIEAYISKKITEQNDSFKPSEIRYAMNDYIRILAQAREDEAYMKDRLSVNVGTLSLIESRNSINQSRSTGRVTFLAFIFLPLSLVTSFFGMNIQELTGNGSSVNAFCAAAVCTTAFTIFLWALTNFILRLVEAWKEYDREIVESRYELDDSTSSRIRNTWKKIVPEKKQQW